MSGLHGTAAKGFRAAGAEVCGTMMGDSVTLVLWAGSSVSCCLVKAASALWSGSLVEVHSIKSCFACAGCGLLRAFSSCQAADVLLPVHAWCAGMGCKSAATTPAQFLHPSMPGPTAVAEVAAGLVAVAAVAVAVEVTAVAAGVVLRVAGHPVAGRRLGGSGRPRCPSLSALASW